MFLVWIDRPYMTSEGDNKMNPSRIFHIDNHHTTFHPLDIQIRFSPILWCSHLPWKLNCRLEKGFFYELVERESSVPWKQCIQKDKKFLRLLEMDMELVATTRKDETLLKRLESAISHCKKASWLPMLFNVY